MRWILLAATLLGCAGSSGTLCPKTVATETARPVVTAVAPKPPVVRPPVVAPTGYVQMRLFNVVSSGSGFAVALVDDTDRVLLIGVAGSEGLAISLRHAGNKFSRPLTHDLLDGVLLESGVELVKVQIDELIDGTFHGSVHLVHGDRVIELDARSSDAIALALGNDAPIYVATPVLDEAAIVMPGKPGASTHTGSPNPTGSP